MTDLDDSPILDVVTAAPTCEEAAAGFNPELRPLYIRRSIDADLREWIRTRVDTGGMVVLTGDAASGKSRSLLEALAAAVPNWQLFRADVAEQAGDLIRQADRLSHRTVLWLDGLQRYFKNHSVFNLESVLELIAGPGAPVIIAGTIATTDFKPLAIGSDREADIEPESRQAARKVIRVLSTWSAGMSIDEPMVRFHLDSTLDQNEQACARQLAQNDARLRSALQNSRDGRITAALAHAPELVERWVGPTGDRDGQAVITAVVVALRCGHPEPVPAGVVRALAVHIAGAGSEDEWSNSTWARALAWSLAMIGDTSSALRRAASEQEALEVSEVLYRYSYDPGCRPAAAALADDALWSRLIDSVDPSTLADIGYRAHSEGRSDIAAQVWRRAAELRDTQAMRFLGWQQWQKDPADGDRFFREASALGDVRAFRDLGHIHLRRGDLDGAQKHYRRGADLGDPRAMTELGFLLASYGRSPEAKGWYEKAAARGHALAMTNLGYLYKKEERYDEAEQWFRQGSERGHFGAMANLASLLELRDAVDEALVWYRKAAESAWFRVRFEEPGYTWPSEGADEGLSDAMVRFARLLYQIGSETEAGKWFRHGVDIGDDRAAAALAQIAGFDGNTEAAEDWWRRAAGLASVNLTQHRTVLYQAYGPEGVTRHIDIIRACAEFLYSHADHDGARHWREIAESFSAEPAAVKADREETDTRPSTGTV